MNAEQTGHLIAARRRELGRKRTIWRPSAQTKRAPGNRVLHLPEQRHHLHLSH